MKKTLAVMAACTALASSGAYAADAYPARPVQVVVPFSPGGAVDVLTRQLAQRLQARGYTMVIENKPGAGGNIAASLVARANPDGYTLLMGTTNTHGINSALYPNMPYDPVKDFAPIGMVAENVVVLLANQSFPAKNLSDAVTVLKQNPGKYTYASPGVGTVHQLAMEQLKHAAGLDVVHAAYKGAGPAMSDLVAGHVPLMIGGIAPALPFLSDGRVRVLGVANPKRYPALPDTPLFSEVAPGVSVQSWIGLFAPAGTPAPVIERLSADLQAVLQNPEFTAALQPLGMAPRPMTPQAFGDMVRNDMPKWNAAVKASGATQ
ncbi:MULTISPECIES: Bug family tripartite tricarboxylate transporter substrate binding protein [Achromobacter]|uniref:Tripartite tricarboxylate transporter substrate binding protein n=1 Tax=Achromobacter spanius TaxID=217203 RepID=A0ABY8GLI1_9BURK|nr:MULTISPECIES: tripartite tricarboxylate transporter substrate binding protein [Achromobacter]WAI85111.1 tripartite tricarboxylate transporter substrate binding protein [Achromobacter spanius]WEX95193.1 tripartite tricarboxylate transporter substrate binding protein [Achromobacter sp. SS2-2022]WFP05637.1 tripartite tricarboxylate transporter substrate binding protein [Achromobacter spanius]